MKTSLYIWASLQSLFFGGSVLLFRRSRSNALLASFYVLNASLTGLQYLLRFEGFLYTHGEITFLSDVINLSFGPVAYLYLRQVLYRRLPWHWALHLIPSVAFAALFWGFLWFDWQPFTYQKYIGKPLHRTVLGGIALSFSFYAYLYNRTLTDFQRGQPPYRQEVRNWLYIFLAFFLLKALAAYLVFLHQWYPPALRPNSNQVLEVIFVLIDSVIILTSGILVFRMGNILDMERVELFTQLITRKKKPALNMSDAADHLRHLDRLMVGERLYARPDLNEKTLAEALGLQPYQLSLLLNDHLGKTFSEYLNERRIDEAKRRLTDPKTARDTMYAIALDCGYNSESVFYTNFKKYTGTTPKRFQAEAAGRATELP